LEGCSPDFIELADMQIALPDGAEPLSIHSQVLAGRCKAVAAMLASLAGAPSGAACSPAARLDVAPFFTSTCPEGILLFLSCVYSPEATDSRLQAAVAATGGLDALLGAIRLAHRLDAPQLLRAALDWADSRRDELFAAGPTAWLSLAEELQLDNLRARVAAWTVARLRAGGAGAAEVLGGMDLSSLRQDTVLMLLDALASSATAARHNRLPTEDELQHWDGAGSLCRAAAERAAAAEAAAAEEAAAAAEQAQAVQQGVFGFAAQFEAQHEQAAEDWAAEFEEQQGAEDDMQAEQEQQLALPLQPPQLHHQQQHEQGQDQVEAWEGENGW
jgi:hypothetical protein